MTAPGLTVIVPVFNGGGTLEACLRAILEDLGASPADILIVDDGSSDGSPGIAERFIADPRVRLIRGRRKGAAAAINDGIRLARSSLVCQIDQDVIIHRGWFERVLAPFADPQVGAVQGRYSQSVDPGLVARAAALDLSDRYARIEGPATNHVCTGNVAYRAEAVHAAGWLDETLGYGYDNDLSYRLVRAGWTLRFERHATAAHAWRESLPDYLRQQFGVGYGRLDVVARHPYRWTGDDVSGAGMIAHAAIAAVCGGALVIGLIAGSIGGNAWLWVAGALAGLGLLTAERIVRSTAVWRRSGDRAALLFPVLHLLRDAAWACAVVAWGLRRLLNRPGLPTHTMARRAAAAPAVPAFDPLMLRGVAAVVPAYNEAAALPLVIRELGEHWPELHVLVVDDGSTDGTFEVAARLGCEALRLPVRLGVGGAMRAGIRYARERGFRAVIRLDGDGQHAAADLPKLLAPVLDGRADAVVGVRGRHGRHGGARSIARTSLGVLLSVCTRRRVSDPTSGFWAFGPAAMKVLAVHHPTGYPEPELRLVLRGHRLRTEEAAVSSRARMAGITSLTTPRAGVALARALLALVIVPLRDWKDGSS